MTVRSPSKLHLRLPPELASRARDTSRQLRCDLAESRGCELRIGGGLGQG